MVERIVDHRVEPTSILKHTEEHTLEHTLEHTEEPRQEHLVTTVDNPYNPFIDFKEWNAYDEACGYHTLSLLGRMVVTSDELSEADQDLAIEQAVDEIVEENFNGLYRKISYPPGPVEPVEV